MSITSYGIEKPHYWPILIFLGLCALELLAILSMNSGKFLYSLDDPYIHLRVAENIAKGHYGINLSEYSAPSSSILWPFLLAPFSDFTFGEFIPLGLNIMCSVGIVILYTSLVHRMTSRRFVSCLLVMMLVLATNIIGLAFTGMEHTLQIFLALLIVAGIIVDIEKGTPPWWLLLAVMLGPLVRYEFLLLTVITSLYLTCRRHFLLAGWGLAVPVGALLGFSWFLNSLGLEILPNSVIIKSMTFTAGSEFPASFFTQATLNVLSRQGAILAVSFVLCIPICLNEQRPQSERLLALCGILITLGHLLTAPMYLTSPFLYGDRYDMYVFASVVSTLLYLYRFPIAEAVRTHNMVWVTSLSIAITVIVSLPYLKSLVLTPLASHNMYEQQYQMQRFTQNHFRQAVAINDLGLVSYRNPYYVLDLWGLGSVEAMHERFWLKSENWMDRLAKKHNVQAALIYESWFSHIPKNWVRLGTLHLSKPTISAGGSIVSFYALDAKYLHSLNAALDSFQTVLPSHVRLERDSQGMDSNDSDRIFTSHSKNPGHI